MLKQQRATPTSYRQQKRPLRNVKTVHKTPKLAPLARPRRQDKLFVAFYPFVALYMIFALLSYQLAPGSWVGTFLIPQFRYYKHNINYQFVGSWILAAPVCHCFDAAFLIEIIAPSLFKWTFCAYNCRPIKSVHNYYVPLGVLSSEIGNLCVTNYILNLFYSPPFLDRTNKTPLLRTMSYHAELTLSRFSVTDNFICRPSLVT